MPVCTFAFLAGFRFVVSYVLLKLRRDRPRNWKDRVREGIRSNGNDANSGGETLSIWQAQKSSPSEFGWPHPKDLQRARRDLPL